MKKIIVILVILRGVLVNNNVVLADDLRDMAFEKFLDRASGECYDWLGINNDLYCPCFEERLKETATEREKQLYITSWKLLELGGRGREKDKKWRQSEEGKDFAKYSQDIEDYCRKALNKK